MSEDCTDGYGCCRNGLSFWSKEIVFCQVREINLGSGKFILGFVEDLTQASSQLDSRFLSSVQSGSSHHWNLCVFKIGLFWLFFSCIIFMPLLTLMSFACGEVGSCVLVDEHRKMSWEILLRYLYLIHRVVSSGVLNGYVKYKYVC